MDYNNNDDEEEENVNQNYKKKNPNNNYSEIKTPDNELNENDNLNQNNDYNIINNSTLTNNNNNDNSQIDNDENNNNSDYLENDSNKKEDKNNISFDFIIEKRVLLIIKSHYLGKKHTIKYKIKIKNTGYYPIPKSTLKANLEKSDLAISDTLINNGEEILPNQIIDVTLYIFFKDSNNIKNGINCLYINLYDENDENIGNEGTIQIKIDDESRNIEDYNEINEGKINENNSIFNNLDMPENSNSYQNIKNNYDDSD